MLLPVILAGGIGSRLWPLSRGLSPKQFMCMPGSENSLFQQTLRRIKHLEETSEAIVVCNEDHQFIAGEQLNAEGFKNSTLLLEPVGRNTAPAVALAALRALEEDENPILLVLPADHQVNDLEAFKTAAAEGIELTLEGRLVTFGIVPTCAETGYGYIQKAEPMAVGDAYQVASFVEKPDQKTAQQYLDSGDYLWNSGMFMFSALSYLEELQRSAPDIANSCRTAYRGIAPRSKLVSIPRNKFELCRSDSIDYAVMEETINAAVIPLDAGWNDLGAWDALWETGKRDKDGNVTSGDTIVEESANTYVHSQSRLVTAVGVQDLVIVETDDAVMVTDRNNAQGVKKVVEKLEEKNRKEVEHHTLVHRPWGTYRSLSIADGHQVKHIVVNPGAQLSLQLHHHRDEHWTVIKGEGLVTLGDDEILLKENQSTFIPKLMKHRLTNPGDTPVEIIEVQVGGYLGEDDIVRFEDNYGRAA